MITLTQSLAAWQSDRFDDTFKQEVRALSVDQLPLQQAMQLGSFVLDKSIEVMIQNISEHPDRIQVSAGIFFSSVIAGCNCADDPEPMDTQQEYVELIFEIDGRSAETNIRLPDRDHP